MLPIIEQHLLALRGDFFIHYDVSLNALLAERAWKRILSIDALISTLAVIFPRVLPPVLRLDFPEGDHKGTQELEFGFIATIAAHKQRFRFCEEFHCLLLALIPVFFLNLGNKGVFYFLDSV